MERRLSNVVRDAVLLVVEDQVERAAGGTISLFVSKLTALLAEISGWAGTATGVAPGGAGARPARNWPIAGSPATNRLTTMTSA